MAMNRAYFMIFISYFALYSSWVDAQEAASEDIPVTHNTAGAGNGAEEVNDDVKKVVANLIEKNMIMTKAKTQDMLKVVKNKLQPGKPNECLTTCIKLYENSINRMDTSIKNLHMGDYFTAKDKISGIGKNFVTCNYCYTETFTKDVEIQKFNQWVLGVTGECQRDLQAILPN